MLKVAVFAMAFACVVSAPAGAALVDVSFSGASTTAGAYSGRLWYSDDAVQDSGTPFVQRYNLPVNLQFSVNGRDFLVSSANNVVSIDQGSGNMPYDQTFFSFELRDSAGRYAGSLSLNFFDPTGAAMTGNALPTQAELLSFPIAETFFQTFGDNGVSSSGFESVASVVATSAVPEPATWVMMIGGFGLVGSAMRRRQKVQTKVKFA